MSSLLGANCLNYIKAASLSSASTNILFAVVRRIFRAAMLMQFYELKIDYVWQVLEAAVRNTHLLSQCRINKRLDNLQQICLRQYVSSHMLSEDNKIKSLTPRAASVSSACLQARYDTVIQLASARDRIN